MLAKFDKDPDSTLDYAIDWSSWLRNDEIASVKWVVPDGLTLVEQDETTKIATIWLSGGVVGEEYDVVCRVTTTGERVDDRTITIRIRQK